MVAHLPPLQALRAFEAAGRLLSFTKAAGELCVTPAAVSQQVAKLEEILGTKLFRRESHGIALTPAGRSCLVGVRAGLGALQAALDDAQDRESGRARLRVYMPPCFGAVWVLPRIAHFIARHPDIDLQFTTVRGEFDIAIRYVPGPYAMCRVERLFEERIFPVCAPALMEGRHPVLEPDDLRWHTLLHDDATARVANFPSWQRWLDFAGASQVDASAGPRFDLSLLAIQACEHGAGVALARSTLVAEALATGRLVRPLVYDYPTRFAYHVVYPEVLADSLPVAAFRDWLFDQALAWSRSPAARAGLDPAPAFGLPPLLEPAGADRGLA